MSDISSFYEVEGDETHHIDISEDALRTALGSAVEKGDVGEVKRLLRADADPNSEAMEGSTHVLHLATKNGQERIVDLLLKFKADADARNAEEQVPLDIAIKGDTYSLVRTLVAGGATLFPLSDRTPTTPASIPATPDSIPADGPLSPGMLLFEVNNAVAIAAAAAGLRQAPNQVASLTTENLLKFLETPGMAPVNMLRALFKQRDLVSFDFVKDESDQVHSRDPDVHVIKTAYMPASGMNVAEGVDARQWNHEINDDDDNPTDDNDTNAREKILSTAVDTTVVTEDWAKRHNKFVNKLAPQQPSLLKAFLQGTTRQSHHPVRAYQCLMPDIHRDARVLAAMANTKNEAIFDQIGCQALVKLEWKRVETKIYIMMVLQALSIAGLALLTQTLHPKRDEVFGGWAVHVPAGMIDPQVVAWCNVPFWMVNLVEEVAQIVGYLRFGVLSKYCGRSANLLDAMRIVVWACALFPIAFHGISVGLWTRYLLGVPVFWSWMRLLYYMRLLKSVGKKMLPIIVAAQQVTSILLVVIFWLLGFTHLFFTLGFDQVQVAFMSVYRLAILGDLDLDEMEDRLSKPLANVLVVLVGFMMTVTIMNVFIGVLGAEYNKALSEANRTFRWNRARAILDIKTTWAGIRTIFLLEAIFLPSSGREPAFLEANHSPRAGERSSISLASKNESEKKKKKKKYLWYAVSMNASTLPAEQLSQEGAGGSFEERVDRLAKKLVASDKAQREAQRKVNQKLDSLQDKLDNLVSALSPTSSL